MILGSMQNPTGLRRSLGAAEPYARHALPHQVLAELRQAVALAEQDVEALGCELADHVRR